MASDKTLALRAKQPRQGQPHRPVLADGSLGEPLVVAPSLRRQFAHQRRRHHKLIVTRGVPPWVARKALR